MRTQEIKRVRRIQENPRIPDGEYEGTLAGAKITFSIDKKQFEAVVENGIRGTSPCLVVVEKGVAVIKDINHA